MVDMLFTDYGNASDLELALDVGSGLAQGRDNMGNLIRMFNDDEFNPDSIDLGGHYMHGERSASGQKFQDYLTLAYVGYSRAVKALKAMSQDGRDAVRLPVTRIAEESLEYYDSLTPKMPLLEKLKNSRNFRNLEYNGTHRFFAYGRITRLLSALDGKINPHFVE